MEKEDKILVLRAVIGVLSGIISFILVKDEIGSLIVPLMAYAFSIGIVYGLIKNVGLTKWDLLGRGVSILFASWLLIFVILYNV
ncbi:hypothetical protein [Stygiolobus caldivivus]|uniref:Uncharacterized protein n=1 Tax=Stygiolobus caldivivus TaxID=2824673 RepID=A0A8D5ZJA4_9CREN|nr:hypothetical protein [Stygiolobus caldivivus]BCU70396.1 hypothetical protein KN1_16930 [Stygiolobus caldivivus]